MTKISTVSIIDDDPITIFGITKMLNALDCCDHIETYMNGEQAIRAIRDQIKSQEDIPEVIFLDINMPIMDGWQFLEEFIALKISQTIRINIVTSSIDPVDRQNWEDFKNRTHHQIEFMNKPMTRDEVALITEAVKQS
ncbi:response regulator [Zeaxanthinibacter sp. PT1]|uniref:response regulator n=1 Tax=Zeaxanthinibacter TaxID=561554 RepID=UPI002349760B|nr:response regulator [Zeaxanthinibacter sp. PT1]MDC6351818.1 response regulator [Zeaxanthinibacter sp. PT1]